MNTEETKRPESFEELKPCPFCGCAMSWKMINSHGQFAIVGDHKEKECPLFWMHWGGGIWEDEKAAFSKDWNTRAVPECPEIVWRDDYYAFVEGIAIGKVSDDGYWTLINIKGECEGDPIIGLLSSKQNAMRRVRHAWREFWAKLHGGAK